MDEKVTIYTIAKELNLTPSSVSRAFNPNTRLDSAKRRLILETADKYCFRPNKMASRLSMNEIKIGILIYAGSIPFCERLIDGINYAKQRMSDYKIVCDMRVLKRSEHMPDECTKTLREFTDNGYHGVILSGMYDQFIPEINEAINKGCKIVTMHYRLEESNCLFSSTHNFKLAGQLAADFIHAARRKSCLIVTGDLKTAIHRRVKSGFLDAAALHGIEVSDTIDSTYITGNREDFFIKYLSDHKGEFDSIYTTNGDSIELCNSVHRLFNHDDITFVTSDIYPELCEFIKNGTVNATIFQNQFRQAEQAYELLANYLMMNSPEPEPVDITPILITRSALEYYS